MSSVRRNMRKALYVLLTAALVVSFAFILVACDKDTTETFEMTSDDIAQLRTMVSSTRNSTSFTAEVNTETETSDGTVHTAKTVTIYSNGAVQAEITTTAADGSVTREVIYANSSNYAHAVYENGASAPSESTFDAYSQLDGNLTYSAVLSQIGHAETITLLDNIISASSSYIISEQTGTRYLSDGNLTRTVYSLSYDNERGSTGTISVTAANDAITQLELSSGDTHTTVAYSYGTGEERLTINRADWFAEHPAP